jgi:Nucleotidyl transferase AbiEii toxin, Type IV TA system
MHDFIELPPKERAAVFEETAARMGIGRAMIVEKDFWVCWTLAQLFGPGGPADVAQDEPALVFKGGTSLSKVYALIDRFSEDIDLVVDRRVLIDPGQDPEAPDLGKNERKRRIESMIAACESYVQGPLAAFLTGCGVGAVERTEDLQTLEFRYPRSLPDAEYGGPGYVNAAVRLEFGARGDLLPSERGGVTPYAAQQFPAIFSGGMPTVCVLSPRRTFWEKATILHAHASQNTAALAQRQSRHYSDLTRIAASRHGEAALVDTAMLFEVAHHKARYFPSPTAQYELAVPGSLRLLPPATLRTQLAQDYANMREMFIATPPSFDEMLDGIAMLESRINGTATP